MPITHTTLDEVMSSLDDYFAEQAKLGKFKVRWDAPFSMWLLSNAKGQKLLWSADLWGLMNAIYRTKGRV